MNEINSDVIYIPGAPNENIVRNHFKHSIVERILVFKR